MSAIEPIARAFFEACEAGKGWGACQEFCAPNASFSCQADALAEIKTLEGYADWMKGLFGPIPDGAYTMKAWGLDTERNAVVASAVFTGTQTGEGGRTGSANRTGTAGQPSDPAARAAAMRR